MRRRSYYFAAAIALLLACLLLLPGQVFAKTQDIEINSGASKSGGFVSITKKFKTKEGKVREIYMTGLKGGKSGNVEAVMAALEENYDKIESGTPLRLIDDAFCDAEKYASSADAIMEHDSLQCWAASAANMLWISGWAKHLTSYPEGVSEFTSEDHLFELYNDRFTDKGGEIDSALNWFFMGEYFVPGIKASAGLLEESALDGYRKDFVSMNAQNRYDMIENPQAIEALLRCGAAEGEIGPGISVFQGSTGEMLNDTYMESGHSITIAGVIIDPEADSLAEKFKSIIIINSDNDSVPSAEEAAEVEAASDKISKMNELRKNRPNSYNFYPLELHTDVEGTTGWIIPGYPDKYYKDEAASGDEEYTHDHSALYSIDELPFYSDAVLEKYKETEGSMDHMKDIDVSLETICLVDDASKGVTDPYYGVNLKDRRTDFEVGEKIYLNYFVANKSALDLTEYEKDKELIFTWSVKRDSDGVIVAEGTSKCGLPHLKGIEGGTEQPDLVFLNEKDGEVQNWETGSYTLSAELNKDHRFPEAYYKNNVVRTITFNVLPTKEMAADAAEKAKAAVAEAESKVENAKQAVEALDESSGQEEVTAAYRNLVEAQEALLAAQKALAEADADLSEAEKRALNKEIETLEKEVDKQSNEILDLQWKQMEQEEEIAALKKQIQELKKQLSLKENTLKVSGKTVKLSYSKLKKKAQTVSAKKSMTVSKAKGTVSYKLKSVTKTKFTKFFKINAKTGKITVKKGLKKGTYKLKIQVTAAGNKSYRTGTKSVTCTIKVR